jgi:hypothetical protein
MKTFNILLVFLAVLTVATAQSLYWRTNTWTRQTVFPRKFNGYDFPTYAVEIKADMTCNGICDFYLMYAAQVPNLRDGKPFSFINSRTGATSASFSFVGPNEIRNTIVAMAVNPSTTQNVLADYTLQSRIPMSDNGGIIGGSIGGLAFFCCIVVCCIVCFGICCGARQRYYVSPSPIVVGGYSGGYHSTTVYPQYGSGYSGGYGSSGGNQYSGSTDSGGHSGGNQYSGSTSGGNQYN